MPRKVKKSTKKRTRAPKRVIVAESGFTIPVEGTREVITEQREIATEPEIEIRRPATLAQALTERTVAVVKPRSRVTRIVETRRRAA
jgi:hypothetical protein